MTDHWTLEQIRMAFYDWQVEKNTEPVVSRLWLDPEWDSFEKHLKEESE